MQNEEIDEISFVVVVDIFLGLLLENNREGANESTGPFQQETTISFATNSL